MREMAPIRLGGAEVLPTRNCLLVDGHEVHLEPKVMAVLLELTARPGEVVSRQALMDSVWADRVVGDEVLTRCISELRSALGDRAANPTFIQTVPKRGYRLLIEPLPARKARTPWSAQWGGKLATAALLTIAVAAAGYLAFQPADPVRIAVLPFATDPQDAYFGAGVAEDLINTLVTIPDLRVTSRTSAFGEASAFGEDPDADPLAVGERLEVDALLTGTLRREADALTMSVQLIDASSGDHLWADSFHGEELSVYGMQDAVIAGVTQALDVMSRDPVTVARTTMNVDALDLYLLGRHHWHQRSPASLDRAVGYFQQAIAADPDLAEAHSGLADTYLLQAAYDDRGAQSATELAAPLIERALALNPASADAHASQGILNLKLELYEAAEASLANAVALNPNHTMAHLWRGNAVLVLGELRLAHEHYRRAFELDPSHPAVSLNYLNSLFEIGELAEARRLLDRRRLRRSELEALNARLALAQGDFEQVARLADEMLADPIGANLLRWRMETRRQNLASAESYLALAAELDPGDERVYLAALEHRTLAPNTVQLYRVLDRWRQGATRPHEYKVDQMARAWEAIAALNSGDFEAASGTLAGLLREMDDRGYPAFRLKLFGHLLIALQASGQSAAYGRWKAEALVAVQRFAGAGWGSFEFHLERAFLLAAAGEVDAAASSFRAADQMGDLSGLNLSADPRIPRESVAGALADFI